MGGYNSLKYEIIMYHVSHQGQQFGPYTVEQINQYLAQGTLDGNSHVWDANTNQWIPITQVPDVSLASTLTPVPLTPSIRPTTGTSAITKEFIESASTEFREMSRLVCIRLAAADQQFTESEQHWVDAYFGPGASDNFIQFYENADWDQTHYHMQNLYANLPGKEKDVFQSNARTWLMELLSVDGLEEEELAELESVMTLFTAVGVGLETRPVKEHTGLPQAKDESEQAPTQGLPETMKEGPSETVSAPVLPLSQKEPSPNTPQEEQETELKGPVEIVPEPPPVYVKDTASTNGSGVFLNIERDEFRELIISKHVGSVELCSHKGFNEWFYDYRVTVSLRHLDDGDSRNLYLDLEYDAKDWLNVEGGYIVVNVDGSNVRLESMGGRHDTYVAEAVNASEARCFEYTYYELESTDLEKICSGNTIKIRVFGAENMYQDAEPSKAEAFRHYCRQFYNSLYDSSAFKDSLKITVANAGGARSTGCFGPDTIITCPTGKYKISSLSPGDWVLSYDIKKRLFNPRKIIKTISHSPQNCLELNHAGTQNTLSVTKNHRLLTEKGWVNCGNLNLRDYLVGIGGGCSVKKYKLKSKQISFCKLPVYNLSTEGESNYIANGLIAHNYVNYPTVRSLLKKTAPNITKLFI